MLSSNPNTMHKNSLHRRNDSGELDVFEAARYFSDQNPGVNSSSQKFMKEDRQNVQRSAPRMSLDLPKKNPIPPEYHQVILDQKMIKESTKYKQPSSPGGKLASFLNSLFNQTHSKKKKSKSTSSTNKDFEEESHGGRRKRRSSISHFRITSNTITSIAADSKSSPCADTPTKSYKEFRNLSSHQNQVISLPKISGNFNPTSVYVEEKSRLSNGVPEKISKNGSFGFSSKIKLDQSEEEKFRKFNDADDGADSDSSSDLFDLPNHDLDFYSNGLPVYESTHMNRIKIGTPISRATTV